MKSPQEIPDIERKNSLPDLMDVDFEVGRDISEISALHEEDGLNYYKHSQIIDATFSGKPIKINFQRFLHFTSNEDELNNSEVIIISVLSDTESNKDIASVFIQFDYDPELINAYTDLENKDRSMKNLGRSLWRVALNIIQKISDSKGVPVKHEVSRFPRSGLGVGKWEELFGSILKNLGYDKEEVVTVGENGEKSPTAYWFKTYYPQKSTA